MNSNLMQCDDSKLKLLLAANDHDAERDPWMQHVEQCSQCQSRLRELAADDDQWQKAAAVLGSEDDDMPCFRSEHETTPSWNEAMVKQLLDPPSHPEMLGRLGRYEMERMIGSGGMGIVFKAFDTELNRVVAVKLLAPYLAARGSARQRFAREARAAAGVRDDHVVPIFNVESEDEPPFLVMQYVAGGSLQEKLDRDGPLEVAEVLRIGLQTAKGLAAAHAQGLIHRDVKPSNILLDEGVERALLTDFGLARAEDDACLTRSGFHPGTPHYMSPEQVRGEEIDGRSDLFSLGCVLYALCAGHSPFRADTSYAVMRRITDEAPRPIRELNANIPLWLEAVVMKLLSKSREDRFSSAAEVAEVLAGCLAHVQEPITTPLPIPVAKLAGTFRRCSDTQPAKNSSGFRFTPISKFLAAAASAFFLIFGTIIYLEIGKGTIRIETNSESDVPIVIRQGDEIVEHLTVSKDGAATRLKAGEYLIEVAGGGTQFKITGSLVTLNRGETWLATISQQAQNGDQRAEQRASVNSLIDSGKLQLWLRKGRHINIGATILKIQDQLDDQGYEDLSKALIERSDRIYFVPMSKVDPLYEKFTFHGLDGFVCISEENDDELCREISDLLDQLYESSYRRRIIRAWQADQARAGDGAEDDATGSVIPGRNSNDPSDEKIAVVKERAKCIAELQQLQRIHAPRHPVTMQLSERLEQLDRLLVALKSFKYPKNGKNGITVWRQATPRSGSFSTVHDDDVITLFDAIDSFEDRCAPMDKTAIAVFSEDSSKVEIVDYMTSGPFPTEHVLRRGQLVILLAPPEAEPAGMMGAGPHGSTHGMSFHLPSNPGGSWVGAGDAPELPPYFAPIPDQADGPRAISEVLDQFNRQMAGTQSDYPQPPLTVDEVRSCCLWKLETDDELTPEMRRMLTDVGIGRSLPKDWAIEGGGCMQASTIGDWAHLTSVYHIQLVSRDSDSKVTIRKRYLLPPEHFLSPLVEQPDSTAIPLANAVAEFNAMSKSVDGIRQPPLTVDEVVAAVVDLGSRRDDHPVDNATFANFQRIAKAHALPAGSKLEVLPNFVSESGDTFKIWSVRIVMPQVSEPDRTYAFEIRRQYISVDLIGNSTIHWGKPNDDGLQAGFRLIPSQRRYLIGQKIGVEFFYRSISGKELPATLYNAFDHKKLEVRDQEGNGLTVTEFDHILPGGAIETVIGETPEKVRGKPLRLIGLADTAAQSTPNVGETVLNVTPGTKIRLQFQLSDFSDGTLSTGDATIEIAEHERPTAPTPEAMDSPIPTPEAAVKEAIRQFLRLLQSENLDAALSMMQTRVASNRDLLREIREQVKPLRIEVPVILRRGDRGMAVINLIQPLEIEVTDLPEGPCLALQLELVNQKWLVSTAVITESATAYEVMVREYSTAGDGEGWTSSTNTQLDMPNAFEPDQTEMIEAVGSNCFLILSGD